VLDVGQQQFLMLLFVLQPQRHESGQAGIGGMRVEQLLDAVVDRGAIPLHIGQRRSRDEPALRARVYLADALVVAVEQHPKARIERPEAGLVRFQDEGLEEPGGVREVPLRRAGIRHRLNLAILR